MLTDRQITDIAREYGEEKANEYSYAIYRDPDTKREEKACSIANQAAPIIRWLSKRYCLVEKDNIEKYFHSRKYILTHQDKYAVYIVRETEVEMRLLRCLFPHIAKEVEDGMV